MNLNKTLKISTFKNNASTKLLFIISLFLPSFLLSFDAICYINSNGTTIPSKITVSEKIYSRYNYNTGELLEKREYWGKTNTGRFFVYGLDFEHNGGFSIMQLGEITDGTFKSYRLSYINGRIDHIEWTEDCKIVN